MILEPDLFSFMIYREHIHELEGVSHRFGPGMIVEADCHRRS